MRILILIVLMAIANVAFAQSKPVGNGLSEKKGILFLECAFNSKDPYFIETSVTDFISLVKMKDTVTSIVLGTPGDHVMDLSYIEYLDKTVRFDSTFILIADTNHLGIAYEHTFKIYYAYGTVRYEKLKGYKLARHFKKLFMGDNTTIGMTEEFMIVEEFVPGKAKPSDLGRSRVRPLRLHPRFAFF